LHHSPICDDRYLVLLGWMVTGLLLSQTVCFDEWKRSVPLNRSLPAAGSDAADVGSAMLDRP